MGGLSQRVRNMQAKLLAMRVGSGAYILPQDIKRIHLRFAPKLAGGHMGPRKFWHNELVRLKYHNPAIPMTIDRNVPQDSAATLSIHYASSSEADSSSATSSPAPTGSTTTTTPTSDAPSTDRVETIEMKNRTSAEILEDFVRVTKAFPVEPTESDKELARTLEEKSAEARRDSAIAAEVRARIQREKDLLEQARGEMAKAEAESNV